MNTTSKRKKKGGKVPQPVSYIDLTAAILNLIVALILIYEKLTS